MDAVPALVGRLVQVARILQTLHELLDAALVAGLGRADEVVIGYAERLPQLGKLRHLRIAPLLRSHAVLGGRLGHFLAVFVEASEEAYVAPLHAHGARHRIGGDGGVGRADVRLAVHVVDGRGDEEGFVRHVLSCGLRRLGATHGQKRTACRCPGAQASWLRPVSGVDYSQARSA